MLIADAQVHIWAPNTPERPWQEGPVKPHRAVPLGADELLSEMERAGATPREVLEVILQSAVNFGEPSMLHALKIFVQLMAKEGRLAEIGNPPPREDAD